MRRLALAALLFLSCKSGPQPAAESTASTASSDGKGKLEERALDAPGLRLPSTVRPIAYRLDLKIVPGEETFTGKMQVDVEMTAPTRVFWLNARDITPLSATVT